MQKGFLKTSKPFFFANSPIVHELCTNPKKPGLQSSPLPRLASPSVVGQFPVTR
jgi:hypothetical protein